MPCINRNHRGRTINRNLNKGGRKFMIGLQARCLRRWGDTLAHLVVRECAGYICDDTFLSNVTSLIHRQELFHTALKFQAVLLTCQTITNVSSSSVAGGTAPNRSKSKFADHCQRFFPHGHCRGVLSIDISPD